MDYTGQYQFAGAQPYHQFMPIPPLTPSHSHSAASDDFNTSPPQDAFETVPQNPNDQGQQYELNYGFAAHPTAFPGPPTPPSHNAFGVPHQQQQQQQHMQQQQQQQQLRHGSSSHSITPAQGSDLVGLPKPDPGADDPSQVRGGSEDEENLTPAQSRRKAQNRAAQRAFRERKERHVKDLEAKLANLEAAQHEASTENERLKRDLQKMSTENEILRATSQLNGSSNSLSPEPRTFGPLHYSPTDFYSTVLQNHANKTPSHRIVTSEEGERLLAAGATWDMIINHESFKAGLVDVGDVSERLKNCARCDGQGPVFSERVILAAIEQSVACGSDDLL